MLDQLTQSPLGLMEAILPIGFSIVASLIVYMMYQLFYGSRHIGAGVHRTFIIGGPAITALFLGIQTSIPLSLGLLGALSFVRFRTPVKDPAEIGFLLLLIASSIGAATNNYLVTAILFGAVFVALSAQRLGQTRLRWSGTGNLIISTDQSSFHSLETKLTAFLNERVPGLTLVTMSVLDNRTSCHYQYRRSKGFDRTAFSHELEELTSSANVEVFIN